MKVHSMVLRLDQVNTDQVNTDQVNTAETEFIYSYRKMRGGFQK